MFFKKLFFASAAVLMLALAYHFGARSVSAQGGGIAFFGSSASNQVALAVYPNGDVYYSDPGHGGSWELGSSVFGGAPNGRSIVQVDGGEVNITAVASNGEVFHGGYLGGWSSRGVPPGGATGAIESSWGALKLKAR